MNKVTIISMLLSMVAYSYLFGGWPIGIGFTLLLLVHEMGHFFVMQENGMDPKPPVFIPFLGAVLSMTKQCTNVFQEAMIGIAGPLAGTIASLACFIMFLATDQEYWIKLSMLSFGLNMFNMIPISPLDGGRVVAAISKWIWVPGGLLLLPLLYQNPINGVIIALFVGINLYVELVVRPKIEDNYKEYYQIPVKQKIYVNILYFTLTATLIFFFVVSCVIESSF